MIATTAALIADDSHLELLRLHERGYAELAILLLRDNGVSDVEILRDYTLPQPRADRAWERQYRAETGLRIRARDVKQRMREMLMH